MVLPLGFVSGLKHLFSKGIYTIIVSLFLIVWILSLVVYSFFPEDIVISEILVEITGLIVSINLIFLVITLFKSLDELKKWQLLLAVILGIPTIMIFQIFALLFYGFCVFMNTLIMAFFAFKVCMDISTGFDDYLYSKENSRVILRLLEFVGFGIFDFLLISIIFDFIGDNIPALTNLLTSAIILSVFLLGVVVLRLFFTKKLAAYMTFFFLMGLGYLFYQIFNIVIKDLYSSTSGAGIIWTWISFLIELILFFYVLGSVFYRVDYIKEKFKIFNADTIAMFIIIMKLIVYLTYIFEDAIVGAALVNVDLSGAIFYSFLAFTLLFGIHSIFAHKSNEKDE